MSKAYPYPQIVTNEEWHVLETTDVQPEPRTDNLNRQMYVPMDRECNVCGVNHSRMIRRHELGHTKWSPKTAGKLLRGTRSDALKVLESVRINYLLGRALLHVDEWLECEMIVSVELQKLIYESSIADIILYGIQSYSTQESDKSYTKYESSKQYEFVYQSLVNATQDESLTQLRRTEIKFAIDVINNFIGKIINHNHGQTITYRKVQKTAEMLSKVLETFMDKPERDDVVEQPDSGEGESDESSEDSETEKESESAELDTTALEKRMKRNLIDEMRYTSTTHVGHWGDMKIHEPPLTVNLQGRLKGSRAYRPADFGYNPKYINRYCIDKKIFKQKQRTLGGTILIDASGSMQFNGQDILDIMEILPAVTIAMYNGWSSHGHLRVIARNGRRVTENYLNTHSGMGNVVDGPALDWLATMPSRRIWVSDMHVFGAGNNSNGFNLLKYCYDVCLKSKIINLKDIQEVKEHALKLNVV